MALREVLYIDLQTGQATTHLVSANVEVAPVLPRGISRELPPRHLAYDSGLTPQQNGTLARRVVRQLLSVNTARTVPIAIAAALVNGLVDEELMPWEDKGAVPSGEALPTTAPRAPF